MIIRVRKYKQIAENTDVDILLIDLSCILYENPIVILRIRGKRVQFELKEETKVFRDIEEQIKDFITDYLEEREEI